MLLLKSLGLASICNLQPEPRGKRKMDVPKVLPSPWDLRVFRRLKLDDDIPGAACCPLKTFPKPFSKTRYSTSEIQFDFQLIPFEFD